MRIHNVRSRRKVILLIYHLISRAVGTVLVVSANYMKARRKGHCQQPPLPQRSFGLRPVTSQHPHRHNHEASIMAARERSPTRAKRRNRPSGQLVSLTDLIASADAIRSAIGLPSPCCDWSFLNSAFNKEPAARYLTFIR